MLYLLTFTKATIVCDSTVIPMTITIKEHIFLKVLYDEKNCAEHYWIGEGKFYLPGNSAQMLN